MQTENSSFTFVFKKSIVPGEKTEGEHKVFLLKHEVGKQREWWGVTSEASHKAAAVQALGFFSWCCRVF